MKYIMKFNLIYCKHLDWLFNQYIDIDDNNFIVIMITDEGVGLTVMNWNYEFKYNKSYIDLI